MTDLLVGEQALEPTIRFRISKHYATIPPPNYKTHNQLRHSMTHSQVNDKFGKHQTVVCCCLRAFRAIDLDGI